MPINQCELGSQSSIIEFSNLKTWKEQRFIQKESIPKLSKKYVTQVNTLWAAFGQRKYVYSAMFAGRKETRFNAIHVVACIYINIIVVKLQWVSPVALVS
jgi:hypothetical protein